MNQDGGNGTQRVRVDKKKKKNRAGQVQPVSYIKGEQEEGQEGEFRRVATA